MAGSRIRESRAVQKVAATLFSQADAQGRFIEALAMEDGRVSAVAWLSAQPKRELFIHASRPGWLPDWIDVAAEGERPGALPAHEAGEFYCLDLSSAFSCAPLSHIEIPPRLLVDTCAAPGGKGILARRYLSPALVVANEVIRNRTAQLIANYKRCQIDPALVTSCDLRVLADSIPGSADLVIVDAPCSGQSLVLKNHDAPGAFHPATISMNERRQRRILAHASSIVGPNGYLLYSTCTFSREENEDNLQWLLETFPEFSAVSVPELRAYQSHLIEEPCYRLWPYERCGAGAFCALLRKMDDSPCGVSISADNFAQYLRPVWRSPTLFSLAPPPPSKHGPARGRTKRVQKRKPRERLKVGDFDLTDVRVKKENT
jgi:16S rRNA C967 or C1407 C5-methylase (RsmB/RsmF family)